MKIGKSDRYYPFGMRLAGLSTNSGNDNKHLYNGKELEEDFNLHWYHYGARYYDPQLGRWHAVDPADEFYSAYVYCHNDPVNFLDPDGANESKSFATTFDQAVRNSTNEAMYQEITEPVRSAPKFGAGFAAIASTMKHSGKVRAENAIDLMSGNISQTKYNEREENRVKTSNASNELVAATATVAVTASTQATSSISSGGTGLGHVADAVVNGLINIVDWFFSPKPDVQQEINGTE